MKFPETLLEFQEQFPDAAAYWKELKRLRWPLLPPLPAKRVIGRRISSHSGSIRANTPLSASRRTLSPVLNTLVAA